MINCEYKKLYLEHKKIYLEERLKKECELIGGKKNDNKDVQVYDALLKAVNRNLIKDVRSILKQKNIDINRTYKNGDTLLHISIRKGLVRLIQILIDHKIDINSINVFGNTPLHELAETVKLSKTKSKQIFESLNEEDVKLNEVNDNGNTPLHIAVIEINVNIVKLLVEEGAKKKIINDSGSTPIKIAKKMLKYESGDNYNYLIKIIKKINPKEAKRLTPDGPLYSSTNSPLSSTLGSPLGYGAYDKMATPGFQKIKTFDEFLRYYFKQNYYELKALLSMENQMIKLVIKCSKPPYMRDTYVLQWKDLMLEQERIYNEMLVHGKKPIKKECWTEPTIDLYLLFLLLKIKILIKYYNVQMYQVQSIATIPYNNVIINNSYRINIQDGSDTGNYHMKKTLEGIAKLLLNTRYNANLIGSVTYSANYKVYLYVQ